MNLRRWSVSLVLLGVLASGCKKSKVAAADGGVDADAGTDSRGLANRANDADVVGLARAAAACPRDKAEAHFRALLDPDCPAMKAWVRNDLITRKADDARGVNDATLINMIEDADPTVRWLGASALFNGAHPWRKDRASAARVLGATEVEKDRFVGYELGLASGAIDLSKTELADRVIALIRDRSRDPWLRGGVMNIASYNDRTKFPALRDAIEAVARMDADASLRESAIQQLSSHASNAECLLFVEFLHDPERQVTSGAVHGLLRPECVEQQASLLAEIVRRAPAGEADDTFAFAIGELGKPPGTTPATRKRLVAAAEDILKTTKNGSLARSRAVTVMVTLDPSTKAFVAKYRSDPDILVANAAKKATAT